MKTITQMREESDALMQKIGDIRATAKNEGRALSKDERTVIEETLAEVDQLQDDIDLEERTQATREKVAKNKPADVRTDPAKSTIKVTKDEQEKRDRFDSLGEMLMSVRSAASPGGMVDRRLDVRAATGLSEGVPSDGGFLVQTDHASEIIKNTWENSAVLSRIRRITLSGNANSIKINGIDETSRADGYRSGGITTYWTAEAAEKTASTPSFRQITLEPNKLIGLCYSTDELLQDARALEQVITQGFQDEFDYKITDGIINGVGAGMPLGVLNAGCLVTASKETGQAATTFTYKNVLAMWTRLKADSRKNAIWAINQDVEPQLHAMSLPVGTGGVPVYLPANGAAGAPYATLLGRPVIPMEQCQTLGTAGDVILGDFSKYLGCDKGGMKKDVSIHVRFVYDESCFRFVYRFDGQPLLASAITPANSSNTLSHFVVMEGR